MSLTCTSSAIIVTVHSSSGKLNVEHVPMLKNKVTHLIQFETVLILFSSITIGYLWILSSGQSAPLFNSPNRKESAGV